MTRGFKSNRAKAQDAHIATLRVGYLSAIAWRTAEWLAARHAALEDAREALWRARPANLNSVLAEDSGRLAIANYNAREELLEWAPNAARRAWHGKYAFLGHALPLAIRCPDVGRAVTRPTASGNAAV